MHPSEWNTILQNLYSNAKKAIIKSNAPKGRILFKAHKDLDKNIAVFECQDNGIGIQTKYKDRIFDAFFTTAKNRNDDLGTGTGLGLYILHQIITARGGKILVGEPEENYCTKIKIEIPLANKKELTKYGY